MVMSPGNPYGGESYGDRMRRLLFGLPAGGFDPSMLRAPRGGGQTRQVPTTPVPAPAPLMPGQLATGAMSPQMGQPFAERSQTSRFMPAAAPPQPAQPPEDVAAMLGIDPSAAQQEEQPPPEALAPAVEAPQTTGAGVGLLGGDSAPAGPGLLNAAPEGGGGVGLLGQVGGGKFGSFLRDNSDALIMAGAGMMSGGLGSGQGFAGFAQGAQSDTKRKDKAKGEAALNGLLPSLGNLSPQMQAYLKANPEAAQAVIAQSLKQDTATTDDLREYAFAKQQGYAGTFVDFMGTKRASTAGPPESQRLYEFDMTQRRAQGQPEQPFGEWDLQRRRAGAITVGGDDSADGRLRNKLADNEGERWSTLLQAGQTAGSTTQDLELLGELSKIAPAGPITGRLAQMFPGVSNAGDAFQSVISRVAPSLRVPGSGATSDIEYEGMLRSLPQLQNQEGARSAIISMMRAKAQLDVERANVIMDYQNKRVEADEARTRLGALNSRSILTQDLRRTLGIDAAAGDQSGGAAGARIIRRLD